MGCPANDLHCFVFEIRLIILKQSSSPSVGGEYSPNTHSATCLADLPGRIPMIVRALSLFRALFV